MAKSPRIDLPNPDDLPPLADEAKPAKPDAEKPVDDPREPDIEEFGFLAIREGQPLVLIPLEHLEERWAGRGAGRQVVYVEGPADQIAKIRPMIAGPFIVEDLADGALRVTGSKSGIDGAFVNDTIAANCVGRIAQLAADYGLVGVKARVRGLRQGETIARDLARGHVGIHKEPGFDLAAIKILPGQTVRVARRGKTVAILIE